MSLRTIFPSHNIGISVLMFLSGAAAVQRFSLEPANALICLVPLAFCFLYFTKGDEGRALACLILSFVYSCDNGGGVYPETPAVLRYPIYITGIFFLIKFSKFRLNEKSLLRFIILCSIILLTTSINILIFDGAFDLSTFKRDVIALSLMSIFLLYKEDISINLDIIWIGSLGYLFGEVINIFFFFETGKDYLSYDSLKSFIIFPFVYSLIRHRHISISLFLFIIAFFVCSYYGSRMIVISLLALMFIEISIPLIKDRKFSRLAAHFIIIFFGMYAVTVVNSAEEDFFAGIKAISFAGSFGRGFGLDGLTLWISELDPVRFAENKEFFSRPLLEIIFGNGLGSGIFDKDYNFGFLSYDQTAFSELELSRSIYFNLHDFWVDFGLRFGLISVIFVAFNLTIRKMLDGKAWIGTWFGILLINTTFSTAGLILTTLIVRLFPTDLTVFKPQHPTRANRRVQQAE